MEELAFWFRNTNYNIAVVASHGLVVVDFDDEQRCQEWRESVCEKSRTFHVRTARGWHYYFWVRQECKEGHSNGVDVKTRGYCLCPPSLHPSGVQYVGYGSPDDIVYLESIYDVLPDYKPEVVRVVAKINADPFVLAMREILPAGIDIQTIKERLSIEELLGIPRAASLQHLNCPLPSHRDEHASFAIYPDGHFFCYGCGAHGDVVTLYSLLYNMSTGGTIRELGRKLGLK